MFVHINETDGGSINSQQGQQSNASCLGPLSPSIAGIKLLVKAVIDAKPWDTDPLALRMPWNCESYRLKDHGQDDGPLCFAIPTDNGEVVPHPPYLRAIREVREALVAAGHKTIDWKFPDAAEGHRLYLAHLVADGGEDLRRSCEASGEPVLGGTVRGIVAGPLSTLEWWDLVHRKDQYLARQLAAWNATSAISGTTRPVDAVILPAAPYPSFKPGEREYVYYTVSLMYISAQSRLCQILVTFLLSLSQ